MKDNLLVTLADEKFLPMAKQVFSSAYHNAGWKGDYMLLAHEIPDEKLVWFRKKGILVKKCIPLSFDSFTYFYSPVVLDKFYLFTEAFKKWKKIVFIDADTIVKGNLDYLTKVNHFGAVHDLFYKNPKITINNELTDPEAFNFRYDYKYDLNLHSFNTGVFAFNTDIIEPKTFENLFTLFYDNQQSFKHQDQGVLNIYFYLNWERLPYVFNTYIVFRDLKLPFWIKTKINHYILDSRPALWEKGNRYYKEWVHNLKLAEGIDLEKENKLPRQSPFFIHLNSIVVDLSLKIHPKKLKIISVIKITFQRLRTLIVYIVDTPIRIIGKTGIILKNKNPNLYHRLKNKLHL